MSRYSELLGVKVKPEIKDRIIELTNKLHDSGKIEYNGDVFDYLLQQADLRNIEKEATFGGQFQELQIHTNRINEIFIGLTEQHGYMIDDLQRGFEDRETELEAMLVEVECEKRDIADKLTESEAKIKELTELTAVNENKKKELEERVLEQKDTIFLMNNTIKKLEAQIAEMVTLESVNSELRMTVNDCEEEIVKLQGKVVSLEDQLKHAEFNHEKALFEKEKEFQSQLNEILKEKKDD